MKFNVLEKDATRYHFHDPGAWKTPKFSQLDFSYSDILCYDNI